MNTAAFIVVFLFVVLPSADALIGIYWYHNGTSKRIDQEQQ